MPPNTVYVGRPTLFGNNWRVIKQNGVWIVKYKWGGEIVQAYSSKLQAMNFALRRYREDLIFDPFYSKYPFTFHIRHLIGKDLACWCGLDEPCHADVLLELLSKMDL
jgi:hypothetical protein